MNEVTSPADTASCTCADLKGRIERQIVLATWGRIHDLRLELAHDQLCVTARTPSYYIKQLVLHAVYEVLGNDSPVRVEFDIQVGKSTRQVLPGENDLWGVPRI